MLSGHDRTSLSSLLTTRACKALSVDRHTLIAAGNGGGLSASDIWFGNGQRRWTTRIVRVLEVQRRKDSHSKCIQALIPDDISDFVGHVFALHTTETLKRRISRKIALPVLTVAQPFIRAHLSARLAIQYDLLALDERFADDAGLATLLRLQRRHPISRVLVPGCYVAAEDVQFWLRRGIRRLDGIDVYSLQRQWSEIIPILRRSYRTDVNFTQGSIEAIPYQGESFDLIVSSAVLEHVRNLSAMVTETARVLVRGGWAFHSFGPLYYCFGGDHCITAFGPAAGYDHLLLDESEYSARLRDRTVFDKQPDPNLPFWALHEQFSFATASEYLKYFERDFHIRFVIAKISSEGLRFRENYREKWVKLLRAGISETDLLVKSLSVVLQRR